MNDHEPMKRQMADPSMVRCLEAQAEAIWPQERKLIHGYSLSPSLRVLDVGCGIGAFAARFASEFPESTIDGIDLIESHLEIARRKCEPFGPRVRFSRRDAYDLRFPDNTFDLTVCRHMLQSVPDPAAVVREMVRVTYRGGRLHVLAEDYAMIQFHPVGTDVDRFFLDGAIRFGDGVGTDLRIGRKAFGLFVEMGLRDISVDYVVVDTLRVPRELFVQIWEAWRDGFSEVIAEKSPLSRREVDDAWKAMIDCLRDPAGYAVWQIPIVAGIVP